MNDRCVYKNVYTYIEITLDLYIILFNFRKDQTLKIKYARFGMFGRA